MSQPTPTPTTAALTATATATATLALLAALTIVGCHSTTTGASTQPTSTSNPTAVGNPAAAGDPTTAPTAGGCTPWPGLPYLRAAAADAQSLADSLSQPCPDSSADT
jgi:hypothetical protein